MGVGGRGGKRKKGKLDEKESTNDEGKGKAEGKKDLRSRKKYRTKKRRKNIKTLKLKGEWMRMTMLEFKTCKFDFF